MVDKSKEKVAPGHEGVSAADVSVALPVSTPTNSQAHQTSVDKAIEATEIPPHQQRKQKPNADARKQQKIMPRKDEGETVAISSPPKAQQHRIHAPASNNEVMQVPPPPGQRPEHPEGLVGSAPHAAPKTINQGPPVPAMKDSKTREKEQRMPPNTGAMLVVEALPMRLIAALVALALVVGLCGFVAMQGIVIKAFNSKQTTDETIVNFIRWRTTWLGFVITGVEQAVKFVSLSPVTATIASLASLRPLWNRTWRRRLLSKLVLTTVIVGAVSSALNGVSIQRQSSRIVPAIVEYDLQKYTSKDYRFSSTDRWFYRSQTEAYAACSTSDTILRQAMYPRLNPMLYCENRNKTFNQVFVSYHFNRDDSQQRLLSSGLRPLEAFVLPAFQGLPSPTPIYADESEKQFIELMDVAYSQAPVTEKTAFTADQAHEFEELFIRDLFLYTEAVADAARASGNDTMASILTEIRDDSVRFFTANNLHATASGSIDPTAHLQQFVVDYFATVSQWSAKLAIDSAQVRVEYALFNVTDQINFTSVTVAIPQPRALMYRTLDEVDGKLVESNATWDQSTPLVYEIPVANECGLMSCGVRSAGYAPSPHVSIFGDCVDGENCDRVARRWSRLAFGLGRRIEGDSFTLLDLAPGKNSSTRKAVIVNPRDTHTVSMGRFAFQPQDLAAKFDARCDNNVKSSCEGYSVQLTTVEGSPKEHLLLHESLLPVLPGFGLANTTSRSRGKRLLSRHTDNGGVNVEVLQRYNFGSFNYTLQFYENCSATMEEYEADSRLNLLFLEHPLQVTYTATMMFLFHNGRLTTQLPATKGTSLAFLGNEEWIDVQITLPATLFAAACASVAVLVAMALRMFAPVNAPDAALLRSPEVIVRAAINASDFPRSVLSLGVEDAEGKQTRPLDEFVVSSVALRNRQEPAMPATVFFQQDTAPEPATD